MIGVGGESDVEVVRIDEVTIGDATRKGWTMVVAGEHDMGAPVGVILGEDFFSNVDVEFDIEHNVVRLFEPKGCGDRSLAYWATEGAGEVATDRVYHLHPQILISVHINGQPVKAKLDSGAAVSTLHKPFAAKLGLTPGAPGVAEAGRIRGLGKEEMQSWVGPLDTFVIGDERIRSASIVFTDLGIQAEMLLGVDFIRADRMLIAHSQRKIYFTHSTGPVFQLNRAQEARSDPTPDASPVSQPATN